MTVKFLEPGSAHTQDLSAWQTSEAFGGGTITSDAQAVGGSVRSIKCTSVGGGPARCMSPAVVNSLSGRMSVYFRFTALPTNANWCIAGIGQTDFNSMSINVGVSTAGKLTINVAEWLTTATGTTTLSVNTDYRVCLVWNITSASVYTITAYLNGAQEVQYSNGVSISTTNTRAAFGNPNGGGSVPGVTSTVYFSHIYLDDTGSGDTGDVKVAVKRPVANGTLNEFTTQIGAGGSGVGTGHSPQVNERPLSQTNGWSVVNAGSVKTEEFTVQAATAGDEDISAGTIISYAGWAFCKALAAETGQLRVGNTDTPISITTTPTYFVAIRGVATYPTGGTDIGLVTDATITTVSLYECGLLFAYESSAPPVTQKQEGFRFRNDDGSETTATWAAGQDSNLTAPKGTNMRLRILVDPMNNTPNEGLILQYRKVGTTPWREVRDRQI